MTEFIRVELGREVSPGKWEYTVDVAGGRRLCGRSRQPLLDACRQIKSMGGDTKEIAGLFRKGRDAPDLVCGVGWGAGKTVSESDKGKIGFKDYHPFNRVLSGVGQ